MREWQGKKVVDLKNIRQIGSPAQWDKIYVEEDAYDILMENTTPHEIFVLMGRTKGDEEKYESFIEAVIPVHSITFCQTVPVWNSHAWNGVYDEIKQYYADAVIIGWVVCDQGIPLKMVSYLEEVHREQFAGIHQVLMLVDAREKEASFYKMRGGHLVQETGYYVYYDTEKKQHKYPVVNIEEVYETHEAREPHEIHEAEGTLPRGRYREALRQNETYTRANEKKNMDSGKWISVVAIAAVAILLVAIVRTEMQRNDISVSQLGQTMETWSENVQDFIKNQDNDTEENQVQQQVEKNLPE